jgi:hypothetical protein
MDPLHLSRAPEHFWIADRVPCLHWRGSASSRQSAVIYMSGGGGAKEDVAPWIVEQVTAAGINLYSIDLPSHGERRPVDGTELQSPSLEAFLDLIEETIEDLRVVTRYVREDAGIGDGRICIRAISLSASFALAAIAAGIRIDACLSICGSGDLAGTAAFRRQRDGLSPAEVQRELIEHMERLLRIQPLGKTVGFARCSVLMIHGAADQLVPLEHHRALFDTLAPFYIDRPQDCLFLAHAGKHGIRPPIEQIGWTWLIDQLRP